MPLPFNDEVYSQDSFDEMYWLDGTQIGIRGAYLLMTTVLSKHSKRVSDWEHFFMHGAVSTWIVGEEHGECLGIVGEAFPSSIDSSDMQVFLWYTYPTGRPYHAWAGHSSHMCSDRMPHAVDLYLQGYPEFHTSRYMKFALPDVNEPSEWYKAQLYRRLGICIFKDPMRRHVMR